jgi:glutamate racemase
MSEVSTNIKVVSDTLASRRPIKKERGIYPVGIFDSGVGGLTVLRQFMKHLPQEDVIYLADTARVPYGGRPPEEIIEINKGILDYFEEQKVKMVIMACGTSSSIAYPVYKDKYDYPIVSLIAPGAQAAVASTRNNKIGIIATLGTVKSRAYQTMIHEMRMEAEVTSEACPLFVPLIEGGFIQSDETRKVAREYLKPLIKAQVDTIILGCTHYPHLSEVIREIAGQNVVLVDPADDSVMMAKGILEKLGMLNEKGRKGKISYVVTGPVAQFEELGSRLLGKPIAGAKQIRL